MRITIQRESLPAHEADVIVGYSGQFLLPVSAVEEGDCLHLLYCTESFVPLCSYGFRSSLSCVFRVLRGYLRCMDAARDRLLRTDVLFSDGSMVFVRLGDSAVRLVYGRGLPGALPAADAFSTGGMTAAGDPAASVWSDTAKAVMPLLAELAGLSAIVGAKSAMTDLAKKVRTRNPGAHDMLKLTEQAERRWNIQQPVSI